jgi:DNA-binding beta-propeller fold protein YncE
VVTIDLQTHQLVGTPVAVPGGPVGVAAGQGDLVYVTSFDTNSVVTVDTATGRLVGSPIHLPISRSADCCGWAGMAAGCT